MFLVVGITGKVGGATARHLLAAGHPVRAMVRDRAKAAAWAAQGVELVVGDVDDGAAITRALAGVDGAFIMLPPYIMPSHDFAEAKVAIAAYVAALAAAPPPRLVVLSSNGAERTRGLGAIMPLSLLETALAGLALPHAFIRPGGFYENLLYGLQAAQGGTFPVFYADPADTFPMTATVDIGAEAARLLTGPAWTGRRIIEIGSMVSANDVAAALASILGREVAAQPLPRAAWVPTLVAMGFPASATWAFEEIYDGVNAGWIGFGVPGAERVAGTTPVRDVFAAAQAAGPAGH